MTRAALLNFVDILMAYQLLNEPTLWWAKKQPRGSRLIVSYSIDNSYGMTLPYQSPDMLVPRRLSM